ncbi:DUF3263 domain-containing protein [Pseudoclavibacter endophyticus]|nr:DUF3263 domain-containing protein [Pseudoclavibacter endophyticus]
MSPEQIVAFESRHPRPGVLKDNRIIAALGTTPTREYQALIDVVTSPERVKLDPVRAGRIWRWSRTGYAGDARRDRGHVLNTTCAGTGPFCPEWTYKQRNDEGSYSHLIPRE